MTATHWWILRVLGWGILCGLVVAAMPATVAVFVIGVLIFAYFALEVYIQDIAVPGLDETDALSSDADGWAVYGWERSERSTEE